MPGSEFDPALNGRVSLEGSIIASACDIDTGDRYQNISLPDETRTHIKREGEGDPQSFSIHLTHCILNESSEPAAWQFINVIFDGDEEAGLFRVNGETSGVALELRTDDGALILPGKAVALRLDNTKENRLDYTIKLKSNLRNLVVGSYNAIIRYRVEYF